MNLGNLKTMCRLLIPATKTNRVSDTNLVLTINEVVKDLNFRLKLLRNDTKFEATADKNKYSLADPTVTVSRFGKIDKQGLWWNANTALSTDWKRIIPKTLNWLDKQLPKWRDQGSDDPLYYAKHGIYLYIYPTPSATLSQGFWLYFIENTMPMSNDADYPFGGAVEYTEYAILSDTIIKGVEAWLQKAVGKKQLALTAFQEYLQSVEEKRELIGELPDVASDRKARITLKRVC